MTAFELTYRHVRGTRRRVRFEPTGDGRWTRVTEEWTGCGWRESGREIVAGVEFDC